MNSLLHALTLLTAIYLAVFIAASRSGAEWLGTQIDLLPALMVYAGLSFEIAFLSLAAFLGGLWFDSLSANPFGITVLPLVTVGLIVRWKRDLILRDEPYAQFMFGMSASAFTPFLTLLLLLGSGHRPLIGWGSLWQWLLSAFVGGALTPACFWIFGIFRRAFEYRLAPETSFRPDREIKRGRA